MKNKLLISVISLGIVAHALPLFLLHKHPFFVASHSYQNTLTLDLQEYLDRQTRTEILAEVFENLEEEPPLQQDFHELKHEQIASQELLFPKETLPDFPEETFSMQIEGIQLEAQNDGDFVVWEGSPLQKTPETLLAACPSFTEEGFNDATIDHLGCLAASEHFDIEVEYAPKTSTPGYVFKVTFLPRADIAFKRISQNYFFLLDRSRSIPSIRYFLNKQAICTILDYLQPNDTFNILVFDDKIVRFRESNVPSSQEMIEKARTFLEEQGHGGYFSSTDLYTSLGKILPVEVSDTEVNSAILLSDGVAPASTEKHWQALSKWSLQNKGRVSLYSIASGSGNSLFYLDFLSAFNKGIFIHSQEHLRMQEKLCHLIRSIQNPIGKDMTTTAITSDPRIHISLEPKKTRIPDLYQNRPFVVYGSINQLSDFMLFLQGKYYNRRVDIKKPISFKQAKESGSTLEGAWAQLHAQEMYENYFEQGNPQFLEEAKRLLTPLHMPVPLIRE